MILRPSFLLLLLAGTTLPLSRGQAAAGSGDLATCKAQFVKLKASAAESNNRLSSLADPTDAQVRAWLTAQRPNGSWPDIDYADQNVASWQTIHHLARLQSLARIYVHSRAQGSGDAGLLRAILAGLEYWNAHNFRNRNWWYQAIGTPQYLSTILLLMEDRLPPEVAAGNYRLLGIPSLEGVGANLGWTAGVAFKKAALAGDLALAQQAHDAIVTLLAPNSTEGIQADQSYHYHGPQQQFGNYGLAVLHDMVEWACVWRGTAFALTEDQLTTLRKYALQGEAVVVANGAMDISSCGRQIGTLDSQEGKGRTVINLLGLLAEADPTHADAYRAAMAQDSALAGAVDTSDRMYYRSDYLVHRRPGFLASVKMCSRRVVGGEAINGENRSGRYLADGATFVYQNGREYTGIFPVWDWHRIPGVTTNLPGGGLGVVGKMETGYAGGVSDGVYGAAGLDYARDGVTGKKAWFFFDHQLVCLGAGLASRRAEPLVTSVEQCLLAGPVWAAVGHDSGQQQPDGERRMPGASWVWHDGRGYYFAEGRQVVARQAVQRGNWNVVRTGPEPEPKPVSRPIFSLWLDHGTRAANGSYGYVILPDATADQTAAYAAHPQVAVLANSGTVQAVRDLGTNLVAAIFYAPGTIETGAGPLAADAPCAALLRRGAHGDALTVSDPSQRDASLNLTYGGQTMKVALPSGTAAGSSVALPLR